jgi:hypothetical protein
LFGERGKCGSASQLVVMGVPKRKLLSAMCRAECVVDVEDLPLARRYCRAGLIDKSGGESRRLRLAPRILQTADRRLRGQRFATLWTAPNRDLHQRVMPQPVEVNRTFVAAREHKRAPSPIARTDF